MCLDGYIKNIFTFTFIAHHNKKAFIYTEEHSWKQLIFTLESISHMQVSVSSKFSNQHAHEKLEANKKL